MKKAYTFRLDPDLIKELDGFAGSRTENLGNAIRLYVRGDMHNNTLCNTDEIQYLKGLNTRLLDMIDQKDKQISLMSLSWWKKRKLLRSRND